MFADTGLGLTSTQAAERLQSEGPNELPQDHRRGFVRQVWDVIREPILLLLIGASAISFAIADLLDGIVLSAFVFLVIAITVYQERKTELVLHSLRELAAPQALVVRDGMQQRVPGRDIVTGDLIVLTEGSHVPADAVVVSATRLTVDESALTGESVPVRKVPGRVEQDVPVPGGDDSIGVYCGTTVACGHGTAVVIATGARTHLGHIGQALKSIPTERTPLQHEIKRIVSVISVFGLVAAFLIFIVFRLTRGEWLQAGLAGIATAMALLPEEFPVVLSVFMALGAWRMAKHGVLARRSAVIETLGTASVLCVDKTGTLTINRMSIKEVITRDAIGGSMRARDREASTEPMWDASSQTPPSPDVLSLVATGMLASSPQSADPMDRAFVRLAGQLHLPARPQAEYPIVEYPLSPDFLVMAAVWPSDMERAFVACAKGAPEAIAELCRLTAAEWLAVQASIDALALRGARVLAVARGELDDATHLPPSPRDLPFTFIGLVALHDPLRPGVPDAIVQCQQAGVRTVMITGDYPGTALAIAAQAHIDVSGGCMTGSEVDAASDEDLAMRVRQTHVFARMRPEQKLRLVRAFQARHAVVAMTGDGVNDAPALRAAQIGIAFGERGTDVAREAASLVITDDSYESIVEGIRQGRRIFANLRKAMAYVIAVHVPIFGMSLIPVFLVGWPIVLLPIQVAFLELIIDPACSIAFEAEPGDPRTMDRQPRPPGEPLFHPQVLGLALAQGFLALIAVLAVYVWSVRSGDTPEQVRSVTFIALVIGNLALILVNRSWEQSVWEVSRHRANTPIRWIVLLALILLAALITVPPLRSIFDLGDVQPTGWLVASAAGVAAAMAFEAYKLIRRRMHLRSKAKLISREPAGAAEPR